MADDSDLFRGALKENLQDNEELSDTLNRLEKIFKVSKLVILRRLCDVGSLDPQRFETAWQEELKRLGTSTKPENSGGNFHQTTLSRLGRKFAQALIVSTLEGQTLYRDAFRMLGVSGTETFKNLARKLEVAP